MLREAIRNSLQEINGLPVVVLQKVNTLDTNWPEKGAGSYNDLKINMQRNRYLYDFLKEYRYKIVWENEAFAIMECKK